MLRKLKIPMLALAMLMFVLPQAASSRVHVRVFAGVGPAYTYSVPYYGYYGYPRYYYSPYYYRSYSYAPYWGGYGWRWHHRHWR
jgi:hypothetical protein